MTNTRKILIVDDDSELRKALVEQLALLEEFESIAVARRILHDEEVVAQHFHNERPIRHGHSPIPLAANRVTPQLTQAH